jgi:hypothetical protein
LSFVAKGAAIHRVPLPDSADPKEKFDLAPTRQATQLVVRGCRCLRRLSLAAAFREDLLAATERELDKVRQMVPGPRGSLRNADAAKSDSAQGG